MAGERLIKLQALPLDIKIAKSKQRIREWVRHFGEDGVYISFSGGKDSTVLLHLVRSVYPDIKAVYCDTGLEYPEIKEFVKKQDNVEIIRPKKNFKQVIEDYGYPLISKEQSQFLHEVRVTKSEKIRDLRINGNKNGRFKISEKWQYLMDAPFHVSYMCCHYMKKYPFRTYEKRTGLVPILGTLACESNTRKQQYGKYGCNGFEMTNPKSTPIAFWTESDILEYIKLYDLEIASVYGEIKESENGSFFIDGVDRTGCVFCGFGCHMEKNPNRFEKLKISHPKLYEYCIYGGAFDEDGVWKPDNKGLGFHKVLDYIDVDY